MNDYKVQVIWQVPNSPETNMLDLGAWMSIQSEVEEQHRHKVMQNDILAESVETAFANLSESALTNIYHRWKLNLDLIIRDRRDNIMIEKCRNKQDKVEDLVHVDEHVHSNTVVIEDSSDEEDGSV